MAGIFLFFSMLRAISVSGGSPRHKKRALPSGADSFFVLVSLATYRNDTSVAISAKRDILTGQIRIRAVRF
jgi:hypothetical protein